MDFSSRAVGAFLCAAMLSACAKEAEPDRLASLLAEGLGAEKSAKTEQRLNKALDRGKTADQRQANFGEMATPAGASSAASLINAALERNSRIGSAADGISLADAERLNAIFGYLPQVSLSYTQDQVDQQVIETDNVVFQEGQAQYPVTVLAARIEQPIFDLSRIFAITYASNARSQAEIDYVGTVRDVVYEVLDAYVTATQSKARSRALRERMRLLDRQVSSQNVLANTGLGQIGEPDALRSERASLASEEALEAARYSEALGQLSMLSGVVVRDVKNFKVPTGAIGTERRQNVEDLVERGLRENPKMMSAALSVVGSDIERKQAIAADFSPVLEAYATLEQETRDASRFGGGSKTQDQVVGVQLSIPLFNATGTGYATSTTSIKLRQNALEYYALERQLETDIRAAHARLGELSKAMSQASTAARQASSAVNSERRRVAAGESVDLAVSAREIRLAQVNERRAFYQAEYVRTWLKLQYLTGVDLRQGF